MHLWANILWRFLMNYEKIYNDIILKAKLEEQNGKRDNGYFEKHHIKPKSLGRFK